MTEILLTRNGVGGAHGGEGVGGLAEDPEASPQPLAPPPAPAPERDELGERPRSRWQRPLRRTAGEADRAVLEKDLGGGAFLPRRRNRFRRDGEM